MVAQRADDDVVLVTDGEGARKRCCARRRHGCKHQRQELLGEAKIAREALGRVREAVYGGRAASSWSRRLRARCDEELSGSHSVEEALS